MGSLWIQVQLKTFTTKILSVVLKNMTLGITADASDVVSLQGQFASDAGFGIGAGLGYKKE